MTCKDCSKYKSGRCAMSDEDNDVCANFIEKAPSVKPMSKTGIDWITEENPEDEDAYLVTWKCPEWTFSRYVGICDWDAENQRWCVETMKQYQLYSSIEITAWADVEAYKGDAE